MIQPVLNRGLYVKRIDQFANWEWHIGLEQKEGKPKGQAMVDALKSMGKSNVDWDDDIQFIIDNIGV
jgi:hypothetical protein